MKKKLLVIISLLLITLTGCSNYTYDEEALAKAQKQIYHIGDTVSCPGYDVTLVDTKINNNGEYAKSGLQVSDPQWITAVLTIKNTHDDTIKFYGSDKKIEISTCEIIEKNTFTYDVLGYELLGSPELTPGGTKTGYVMFSNTNQDSSNIRLRVSCNEQILGSSSYFTFKIEK